MKHIMINCANNPNNTMQQLYNIPLIVFGYSLNKFMKHFMPYQNKLKHHMDAMRTIQAIS